MNPAAASLRLEKIHVWRGERHVLRGVNVSLGAGELLHVAGPNGTGKTTLLRVATGLLRPEHGEVTWHGTRIAQCALDYQRQFAYAAHEPALKGDLTAFENLRFSVGLKRRVTHAELHASLQLTGVAQCAELPAWTLSAGQRRRVSLARVIAMQAILWLLDEPFANLDAGGAGLVADLLQRHAATGGMALVVAHQELRLPHLQRLELR